MQHLRLGALIVDHEHGIPCNVRQTRGREAHPLIVSILLEAEEIREACEEDDLLHPKELNFD